MKNRKNPANRQFCFVLLLLASLLVAWPSQASAQRVWRLLLDAETFAVTANPKNLNTLYVGGSARRLYRSYDAGRTWDTLVVDFQGGSGWFSNVFVHPVDTNVVIIGGSQFGTVQRSTDNGKTWEKVIDPSPSIIALNGEVITAKPDNSDTLYLGGLNPPTIYRSGDRGATWDSISNIDAIETFLCTIAIRTDSTNVILAGCADGVIHKSIDGGITWYATTIFKEHIEEESIEIPKIIFSKKNPMVGYATATGFAPNSLPNCGIYRTVDGGETWRHFALADTSMWGLALGGPNEDELFAGGFSIFEQVAGAGIVRHAKGINTSPLWLNIGNTIPWQAGDHNVWMMKLFGSEELPLLYMATEAGFFVYDDYALPVAETETHEGVRLSVTSDDVATVTLPDSFVGPFTLRCFDMLGRNMGVFDAAGPGTHRFALRQLSAGNYYLQIVHKGHVIGSALASTGR